MGALMYMRQVENLRRIAILGLGWGGEVVLNNLVFWNEENVDTLVAASPTTWKPSINEEIKQIERLRSEALERNSNSIMLPTLVLCGTGGSTIGDAQLRALGTASPDVKVVIFPG